MSVLFKMRHQLNDLFSDFRKYIAPTYYHDRCERSLHMNLYGMHKRETLLTLAAFISGFILLLFIGLAGPNITKFDSIKASTIFEKDKIHNVTVEQMLLVSGPFAIDVPEMTTYSSHICLWITFYIKGEIGSGAFQRRFAIAIAIRGRKSNNQTITILNEDFDQGGGRFHHLTCDENKCDSIEALHLEYLEFSSYQIQIRFGQLEHFNEKNHITDIEFTFQSINPSFTSLSIWFRFIFLTIAFFVTCWFNHSLHRYSFVDWSMEQKWISLLLILLILYDNPFYPMIYLYGSRLPHLLEIFFENSFFSCLLLYWLCFFHGIRQNSRHFVRFYSPKILVVGGIWLITIYLSSWSQIEKLEKPTLDEEAAFNDSTLLKMANFFFYILFAIYFIYLGLFLLTAFTELRSMPYFDLRLKLQTFMLTFTLTISVLIVLLSDSNVNNASNVTNIGQYDITKIPCLQILPWTYQSSSSVSFLSIFSIANLYICICAYFYFPSASSLADSRIVRDNPTLSMINDSDEDVIYGSDCEQPLNRTKLIETMNDDDDSD